MEKGKALSSIISPLTSLDLNPKLNPKLVATVISLPQFPRRFYGKRKPASLQSLCLGFVGKHLEDLITDMAELALNFPSDIKISIAAIARRRNLLNDEVIVALADPSWEILDVSDSDVSDVGLAKVAEICKSLRAVDISRCRGISTAGVSDLVRQCRVLETVRCGGCATSNYTARSSLVIFKPKLIDTKGDSWEDLDAAEIVNGAESLRWLVWPSIDEDTLESYAIECPRIVVNPKTRPFGFGGAKVPREALMGIALDDPIVENIDPATWAFRRSVPKACTLSQARVSGSKELSVAEKFRLAFVERDTRLAPKRAKNARQHQRRAERERVMTDERSKALLMASKATKFLYNNIN